MGMCSYIVTRGQAICVYNVVVTDSVQSRRVSVLQSNQAQRLTPEDSIRNLNPG
jgi:hypothetical protein